MTREEHHQRPTNTWCASQCYNHQGSVSRSHAIVSRKQARTTCGSCAKYNGLEQNFLDCDQFILQTSRASNAAGLVDDLSVRARVVRHNFNRISLSLHTSWKVLLADKRRAMNPWQESIDRKAATKIQARFRGYRQVGFYPGRRWFMSSEGVGA